MSYLKNPFGLRNGIIVLISDLSINQRGAKCGCVCPNCGGELIARMGEVVAHHFAHTKDACDETAAFMHGMFHIIMQFIQESKEFYAPALAASCKFPSPNIGMTRETVGQFVQIVHEDDEFFENIVVIAEGRIVNVDDAEIAYNTKSQAEAIVIAVGKKKLAIRVQPPQICKAITPSPYLDLPTLVFDASDIDFHSMTSEGVKAETLSNPRRWTWLANKKVESVYDEFLRGYQKWVAKIKKREEEQRKQREKLLKEQQEKQKEREIIQKKQQEEQDRLLKEQSVRQDEWQAARARYPRDTKTSTGYFQVSKRFTQQYTPIQDAYGNRWVQCKICGEIKRDNEFVSYGGVGMVNLGECSACIKNSLKIANE
jgi:hypothetical protein